MVVQKGGSLTFRPIRFAHPNHCIPAIHLLSFISGVPPQTPNAEGIYKNNAQ